jgi:hypothetical protein
VSGQQALAIGLVALLLAVAGVLLRRVLIARHGGVIECFLRQRDGAPWLHGLAGFQPGELHWHRSLSLRLRPNLVFNRGELRIMGRHKASAADAARLGPGVLIVTCDIRAGGPGSVGTPRVIELAMSQDALTGLLAWLEAAPLGYLAEAG